MNPQVVRLQRHVGVRPVRHVDPRPAENGAAEVHPRIEERKIGRLSLSACRHLAESFPRLHLPNWRSRVPMSTGAATILAGDDACRVPKDGAGAVLGNDAFGSLLHDPTQLPGGNQWITICPAARLSSPGPRAARGPLKPSCSSSRARWSSALTSATPMVRRWPSA